MSDQVRPFSIAVPDEALDRLRQKLAAATYPPDGDVVNGWEAGVPLREVKRLADCWRDGFDWREHEARLNRALPQFTTHVAVDGFDEVLVHFVHRPSGRDGAIPLLFCQGWAGSFIEVLRILPLLTEPRDGGPAFDVVAPSLPNFGFSGGIAKPGFGLPQYAECLHKLMLRLGYERYVTQGGDLGYYITRNMGLAYPDHCLASHFNMLIVRPSLITGLRLGIRHALGWTTQTERAALSRSWRYLVQESGYALQQCTRPSTLGFALADSPVGLMAWIYEKLHEWTDRHAWTDDEVLVWVSIYYFSAAGPAASLRIYYQIMNGPRDNGIFGYVPRVPLGLSRFPKEIGMPPRAWTSLAGPVVFEAEHSEGGHFAATECPEALVNDLRIMFGGGGGASHIARRFGAI